MAITKINNYVLSSNSKKGKNLIKNIGVLKGNTLFSFLGLGGSPNALPSFSISAANEKVEAWFQMSLR